MPFVFFNCTPYVGVQRVYLQINMPHRNRAAVDSHLVHSYDTRAHIRSHMPNGALDVGRDREAACERKRYRMKRQMESNGNAGIQYTNMHTNAQNMMSTHQITVNSDVYIVYVRCTEAGIVFGKNEKLLSILKKI